MHNSANLESYKVTSIETEIVGSVHFALSYLNQHTNFPRVFKAETLLADLRKAGELFLRNRVRVDIQKKKVLVDSCRRLIYVDYTPPFI